MHVHTYTYVYILVCVCVCVCRVCVICIAPSHKLFKDGDVIDRIEFQIGNVDRTQNEVSGRYKNKYNYDI